jgi:hypothetical protein
LDFSGTIRAVSNGGRVSLRIAGALKTKTGSERKKGRF